MLNKIIILNSELYAKAVVILNASSIQMVANNNTGKSSFINTLNFLFIVNKNKMDFGDHDWKQTLNHYFPRPNSSYILFEIFTNRKGYYCILINRSVDSDDVNYYIIEREWDFLDTVFFSANGELIRFQELQKSLIIKGIDTKKIEKIDLFNRIYSSTISNNPIVQITDSVIRKGQSLENSFTTVYRYLINSKLITSDALKEALITADNKQNQTLTVFNDNSKKDDIEKLKEHQEEIEKLKSIEQNFKEFKKLNTDYRQEKISVGEMYYCFDDLYQNQTKHISEQIRYLDQEIETNNKEIEDNLEPLQTKLNREIGGLEQTIKEHQNKLEQKQKEEKEINEIAMEYGSMEFAESALNKQLDQLNRDIRDIESHLNKIEKYSLLQEQVEKKIHKFEKEKIGLKSKLDNYDNLIFSHFSKDPESQSFLNTVFSKQISSLKKERIIRPITESFSSFDKLEIYGGQIDISGIEYNDVDSIDEIRQQLSEVDSAILEQAEILKVIKNRKSEEQNLNQMRDKFDQLKIKIEKITKIIIIQQEIKTIENTMNSFDKEKKDIETALSENKQIIDDARESIKDKNNQIIAYQSRIEKLKNSYNILSKEVEDRDIEPITCPTEDTNKNIERLHEKLQQNLSSLSILKAKIDRQHSDLKTTLNNDLADIERFITEVDGKLAAIPDKEKSVEALLDNISSQVTTPVKNFLERYYEFNRFIKSFNNEISQYQVSNIEKIEIGLKDASSLISDLDLIISLKSVIDFNQMSLFDNDQKEALYKLNEYLEKSKNYEFKQLFDISLNLTINGEKKSYDLTKQVESEGTDKTLKLILFMLIIKRFVVSDKDNQNKIVLFVDEILKIDDNNVKELMRFCQQNHFLPICAAKSQAMGVEKFYYLLPSSKNNNKIIVDEERQTSTTIQTHV